MRGYLVQCTTLNPTNDDYEYNQAIVSIEDSELNEIIKEFQELFEEPKSLLPMRTHDHSIPLIPGAKPANSEAYRYSFD